MTDDLALRLGDLLSMRGLVTFAACSSSPEPLWQCTFPNSKGLYYCGRGPGALLPLDDPGIQGCLLALLTRDEETTVVISGETADVWLPGDGYEGHATVSDERLGEALARAVLHVYGGDHGQE